MIALAWSGEAFAVLDEHNDWKPTGAWDVELRLGGVEVWKERVAIDYENEEQAVRDAVLRWATAIRLLAPHSHGVPDHQHDANTGYVWGAL